jgi:hypothetical protein
MVDMVMLILVNINNSSLLATIILDAFTANTHLRPRPLTDVASMRCHVTVS